MKDDAVTVRKLWPQTQQVNAAAPQYELFSPAVEGKRLLVAQTTVRSVSLPVTTVLKAVKKETLLMLQVHLQSQSWGHLHCKPCVTCNYRLLEALLTVWGFGRSAWKQDAHEALVCDHPSTPGFLKYNQVKTSSASHHTKSSCITFSNFPRHPYWSKYKVLVLGLY